MPKTTHGEAGEGSRTFEYDAWLTMKARCQWRKHWGYVNKARDHRGLDKLKVCERWDKSYLTFLADVGRRPSETHFFVRIDSEKDWEQSNCRWVQRIEDKWLVPEWEKKSALQEGQ